MEASAITAFCPIHNTCSNGSTTFSGIGEFIVSSYVLSIEAVVRYGDRILNKSEHYATTFLVYSPNLQTTLAVHTTHKAIDSSVCHSDEMAQLLA